MSYPHGQLTDLTQSATHGGSFCLFKLFVTLVKHNKELVHRGQLKHIHLGGQIHREFTNEVHLKHIFTSFSPGCFEQMDVRDSGEQIPRVFVHRGRVGVWTMGGDVGDVSQCGVIHPTNSLSTHRKRYGKHH